MALSSRGCLALFPFVVHSFSVRNSSVLLPKLILLTSPAQQFHCRTDIARLCWASAHYPYSPAHLHTESSRLLRTNPSRLLQNAEKTEPRGGSQESLCRALKILCRMDYISHEAFFVSPCSSITVGSVLRLRRCSR